MFKQIRISINGDLFTVEMASPFETIFSKEAAGNEWRAGRMTDSELVPDIYLISEVNAEGLKVIESAK